MLEMFTKLAVLFVAATAGSTASAPPTTATIVRCRAPTLRAAPPTLPVNTRKRTTQALPYRPAQWWHSSRPMVIHPM
ncbi:hypothetical protein GCM10009754_37690 [Amycolatopsis minnesotensis]|uniref:Secreted protein n=1 Tax=Amycolatopsis minnesotensis TaxID=337894 RepID=A0ABN2R3N6_9PSEU